jgi:predicted Zn-dependent protease
VRVSGRLDVNAVAGLGGRVVVYDGLIREAESPEELAGVLAHEIEHVKRRHIIQGLIAKLVTTGAFRYAFAGKGAPAELLLNLSFSRDEEREADEGGLERLRAAKIDAAGFLAFFERQAKQTSAAALLSDHPSNKGRSELARKYLGGPSEPVLSPQEWRDLRGICR